MKHQVLFSLKNNEKVFMNVASCSSDWLFEGYINQNYRFIHHNEVVI